MLKMHFWDGKSGVLRLKSRFTARWRVAVNRNFRRKTPRFTVPEMHFQHSYLLNLYQYADFYIL